jgi:hypothetical protein
MTPRWLIGVFLVLTTLVRCARADDAGPSLITREYEVSDLLPDAIDDHARPQPMTPDTPIGSPTYTRAQAEENFVTLVRDTVDPESWGDSNQAGRATVTMRDGTLIVRQTRENQTNVDKLIRHLRPSAAARLEHRFNSARVPKMEFAKAPLGEALAKIGAAANIPLEPDWSSLKNSGLFKTTPVTAAIGPTRAPVAVRALLRAAVKGVDPRVLLDPTPKVMRIVRDDEPPDDVITRVYDARALPAKTSGLDFSKAPPRDQVVDGLLARLKQDFSAQAVREVGGFLIVTAKCAVHRELTLHLDQMELAAPADAK